MEAYSVSVWYYWCLYHLTWSVGVFEDIVIRSGRSLVGTKADDVPDPCAHDWVVNNGSTSCFPWRSFINRTSNDGCSVLILFLYRILTTNVNLWSIQCEMSLGIISGSLYFLKGFSTLTNKFSSSSFEHHELKTICVVCNYKWNFVPAHERLQIFVWLI